MTYIWGAYVREAYTGGGLTSGGIYSRGLYLSGLITGFKRRIYPGGYIRGEGLISDTRKTFRIQH